MEPNNHFKWCLMLRPEPVSNVYLSTAYCSLLFCIVSKALSVALKSADKLSFFLCGKWPFSQHYKRLRLLWPLPTERARPPLRNGLQTAHCLCIHAERKLLKDSGRSSTVRQKCQLCRKMDIQVEGEGTEGFYEKLMGCFWSMDKQIPPPWCNAVCSWSPHPIHFWLIWFHRK